MYKAFTSRLLFTSLLSLSSCFGDLSAYICNYNPSRAPVDTCPYIQKKMRAPNYARRYLLKEERTRALPISLYSSYVGPNDSHLRKISAAAERAVKDLLTRAGIRSDSLGVFRGNSASSLELLFLFHPMEERVAVDISLRLREPICVEKHARRCEEVFYAITWEKQALWLTSVEELKADAIEKAEQLACAYAEFADCHRPIDLFPHCPGGPTIFREFIGSGQPPIKYDSTEGNTLLRRVERLPEKGAQGEPRKDRREEGYQAPLPEKKNLPGAPTDDATFPGQPEDGDDNQLFIQEVRQ